MGGTVADVPEQLVEIGEFFGEGYAPVLDFLGWRVAMLRGGPHTAPEVFHRVERHRETNEVFILTAGAADLIVCDGNEQPTDPRVIPMRRNVAYNIGQGVWHHAVLSAGAHIILVERTDTTTANSDYVELPAEQVAALREQFAVGG
jgi:ureidoglycolate hydrolase